jgi:CMP-N-acetylneuraminic acid synthetase
MKLARRMTAFLPCRAGSTRVLRKNTRPFAGREGGLLAIKLEQLAQVDALDTVVVDSNDPEVLAIALDFAPGWPRAKRLIVRERPDQLGQSSTSTDALIEYALRTLEGDDMLWTHVTSPMVDAAVYTRAIEAFRQRGDEHDSLMSVHRVQRFLWNENGPFNYDPSGTRWPRTQDLTPLYEVDSGIFVVPLELARQLGDRIGRRPHLFELSSVEATDVDWDSDFALAELLYRSTRSA